MTIQRLKAREVYNLSERDIWNIPHGKIQVEFDDGVIDTNGRLTIYSWYCAVFHREYPKTPYLTRHHIDGLGISISATSHLRVAEKIIWDLLEEYKYSVNKEHLQKLAYSHVTNGIYNMAANNLKSHVNTLNILDMVEVMDNPNIKKANDSVEATQLSIDNTYKSILDTLKNDKSLNNNTVAKMARFDLVSKGQLLQCLGPRGFLTDIDSSLFRKPILKGYVEGIDQLVDSMMESRSAAKALLFQKDPVSATEYFNRELQLLASIVVRLHPGDCGSDEYVPFKVRSADLQALEGKYYKGPKGQLLEVMENDRSIIGKTIELRSPTKCHHADSYGVCEACYGRIADSIPAGTNVGHVSSTKLGDKITQAVLSTKHLDGSAKVDDMEISDFDAKYIRSITESKRNKDKYDSATYIKLAERLAGKSITLTVYPNQAQNLSDIDYYDLDKLTPRNISRLNEVMFKVKLDDNTWVSDIIPVSMGSRLSWLSIEALTFIKKKGWKLTEKGNYEIDLEGWDVNLPLFELPMVHTNMQQYMSTIRQRLKKFGHSTKVDGTMKKPTIERTLMEFYNLINSKLTINFVHLEILLLSSMIRDLDAQDHRLPRPVSSGELANYQKNMEMRSCGVSMAYQGQYRILRSYNSFFKGPRPDSPFDNLLCPLEKRNPSM